MKSVCKVDVSWFCPTTTPPPPLPAQQSAQYCHILLLPCHSYLLLVLTMYSNARQQVFCEFICLFRYSCEEYLCQKQTNACCCQVTVRESCEEDTSQPILQVSKAPIEEAPDTIKWVQITCKTSSQLA